MSNPVDILSSSVGHLREIVDELEPGQLVNSAYPSEWTIADVLSHLGSGAVILQRRLEDSLVGAETSDDFAPQVWEDWNAKSASAVAADSLRADHALLERLESVSEVERADFHFVMGPLTEDFVGFVCLRLNEHALHTWDIEVAMTRNATLRSESVEIVIDRLGMIARFTGKPSTAERRVAVRTTDPRRDFLLIVGPKGVSLATPEDAGIPDIELPSEAFIRLVYGRLDPEHTPAVLPSAELGALRQVFPGP